MRKRSSYRPKPIMLDAVSWVIQGNLPASVATDTMMLVRIKNHGALTDICQGRGTPESIFTLSHALITTQSLAQREIGTDWLPEIEAAQNALLALAERGNVTGKYIFRAEEKNALTLAMEVHDAQLDGCTVKQLEDAILAAKQAIKCGHWRKETI